MLTSITTRWRLRGGNEDREVLRQLERSRIRTMKEPETIWREYCGKALLCWLTLLLVDLPLAANADSRVLGPFGGDVRSLAVHPEKPDTFYLGTSDGQIYVSRNTGLGWSRINPGLGRRDLVVDNLAFDPSDPATLYAATWELKADRGQLFRSHRGGLGWEPVIRRSLRQHHPGPGHRAVGPFHHRHRDLGGCPAEPRPRPDLGPDHARIQESLQRRLPGLR